MLFRSENKRVSNDKRIIFNACSDCLYLCMPEISRFYGIIVFMFFNDHNPPHFKVKYSEFEANILIENGSILNGDLPISKLKLVSAWAEIHKDELLQMWNSKNFHKIEPLR